MCRHRRPRAIDVLVAVTSAVVTLLAVCPQASHAAALDWSGVDAVLTKAIGDGVFPGCVAAGA